MVISAERIEELKAAGYSVVHDALGIISLGVREANRIEGYWINDEDAWANCDKDFREKEWESKPRWNSHTGLPITGQIEYHEFFSIRYGEEYPVTISFDPEDDICGEGFEGYTIRFKFEDDRFNSPLWILAEEMGTERRNITKIAIEQYLEIIKVFGAIKQADFEDRNSDLNRDIGYM